MTSHVFYVALVTLVLLGSVSLTHRSDSIQGIDYIATPIQRFLG